MPNAYFSRVLSDTSWESLMSISQIQRTRSCKPLQYKILSEIFISSSDFDFLGKNIAKPDKCYLQYAPQSIADNDGLWNCIIVKSRTDSRGIVLYTAGRTFPLYAAISVK